MWDLKEELSSHHSIAFPTTAFLVYCCSLINVLFSANMNLQYFPIENLLFVKPNQSVPIRKDGNCLFGSLSYFITRTTDYSYIMRLVICEKLHRTPLETVHFWSYSESNDPPNNSTENLISTKMNEEEIWCGDIELFVFCFIFEVQICIFVESTTKWYLSKVPGVETTTTFFLHLRNRHFEPISDLRAETCSQQLSNSVLVPDNLKRPCVVSLKNTSEAYELDKRRKTSTNQQKLIFNGEVLKLFSVMEKEIYTVNFPSKLSEACDKCCRYSTKAYPLTFSRVQYNKIINKKFGKRSSRTEKLVSVVFELYNARKVYLEVCMAIGRL